jgi:uncharacterized protein YciU (UPF0263 family)
METGGLVEWGKRLVRIATDRGICLRLLGSAAIGIRCAELARSLGANLPEPKDLDFASRAADAAALGTLLNDQGYRQDQGIQVATEGRRWTLTARDQSHCVDVFFDEIEFSHRLDLRGRIGLDPVTLTPADLLLANLQYVERGPSDMSALALLLAAHPVGERDGTTINSNRLAEVLAGSWGYYYTAAANLERAGEASTTALGGSTEGAARVQERVRMLLAAIECTPKSIRWRLRALIGPRMKWYNDVERGEVF